jgi:hypothetical protein
VSLCDENNRPANCEEERALPLPIQKRDNWNVFAGKELFESIRSGDRIFGNYQGDARGDLDKKMIRGFAHLHNFCQVDFSLTGSVLHYDLIVVQFDGFIGAEPFGVVLLNVFIVMLFESPFKIPRIKERYKDRGQRKVDKQNHILLPVKIQGNECKTDGDQDAAAVQSFANALRPTRREELKCEEIFLLDRVFKFHG